MIGIRTVLSFIVGWSIGTLIGNCIVKIAFRRNK